MDKPTCSTCDYWCPHSDDCECHQCGGGSNSYAQIGECRRKSPDMAFDHSLGDQWCGDHSRFKTWQLARSMKGVSKALQFLTQALSVPVDSKTKKMNLIDVFFDALSRLDELDGEGGGSGN